MKSLLSFLLLLSLSARAQTVLLKTDHTEQRVARATVTPRITYFRTTPTAPLDSLPTAQLSAVKTAGGPTYLILPPGQVAGRPVLTTQVFLEALRAQQWLTLWQASTNWTGLLYQTVGGRVQLATSTRALLVSLAQAMRSAPTVQLTLTVTSQAKIASQQRLATLKTFLLQQGLSAGQFTIQAATEPAVTTKSPNAWQLSAYVAHIGGVSMVNAERYELPVPSIPVVTEGPPTQTAVAGQSGGAKTTQPVRSRIRAYRTSVLFYASANQVLAGPSASWADSRAGVGMKRGAGGGMSFQWLLSPRVAIGLTADYSQWLVERRFFEQTVQQFGSDQTLRRVALMVHWRLYTGGNVYIQPMGGWQLMQLNQTFSADFPGQATPQILSTNRPALGGAVGYELRGSALNAGRWLLDVGVHYQLTPNQSWRDLSGPLHYFGLKAGLGWASRPPVR